MEIGAQIKRIRKEHGLTQVELSRESNISRSYLGDLEGDRYNPSLDTLISIASALDVDVSVFLSDKNSIAVLSPAGKSTAMNEINAMLQITPPEFHEKALKVLQKLLDESNRGTDR